MKKIPSLLFSLLIFSCSATTGSPDIIPEEKEENTNIIRIDPSSILITRKENPVGINLNYLRDADNLRPEGSPSLVSVLEDWNGKWLRYPGGKKSNYYRFALPPYTAVNPQTSGWYLTERKEKVLDFNEFIHIVKATNTHPYIVVAYDREQITDGITTLQEYMDHAVGWVRYSKEHNCGVTYWEIGNENWHNFEGSSWKTVINDIVAIGRAMKEEDATIKVGANFDNASQLNELLDEAGSYLDFVSCSNYYPGTQWGNDGFNWYQKRSFVDMIYFDEIVQQLKKEKGMEHMEFLIAECNAKEWEGEWNDANDIAHALVCFDMCAQINQIKDITAAMFWNTSWFNHDNDIFNLLAGDNTFRPNAEAIKIWNTYWKPVQIKAVDTNNALTCFAMQDEKGAFTLFVLNKNGNQQTAAIEIDGERNLPFSGSSLFQGIKGLSTDETIILNENKELSEELFTFPPYSIKVLY